MIPAIPRNKRDGGMFDLASQCNGLRRIGDYLDSQSAWVVVRAGNAVYMFKARSSMPSRSGRSVLE